MSGLLSRVPTPLRRARSAHDTDGLEVEEPKALDGTSTTTEASYPKRLDRRAHPRSPLHFHRIELKYFLPERFLSHFIERVSPWTDVDPYLVREARGRTSYPVTSLYFDSYDLQSFFEKEAGLLYRRKVRLRAYEREFLVDTPCFLEIKRRLDAVVLKDRLRLPKGVLKPSVPTSSLLRHLLAHVEKPDETSAEANMMGGWLNLQSTAVVRYQRVALVSKDDPSTRVTVDLDLQGMWKPASILGALPLRSIDSILATGMNAISGRYGILELKCNNVVPGWFHRVVQDFELMRTAYSKYFLVGLALRPEIYEDCDARFDISGGV